MKVPARLFIGAAIISLGALIWLSAGPAQPANAGFITGCGDARGGTITEDTKSTVVLAPNSGDADSSFKVTIRGAQVDANGPQEVRILWEWDHSPPPDGTDNQVGMGSIPVGSDTTEVDSTVPSNATPGQHTVTACWLRSSSETWYFADRPFTVTGQTSPPVPTPSPVPTPTPSPIPHPTATPTPPPTQPPTSPPMASPTHTAPPTPVPTPTQGPTLTPTPTPVATSAPTGTPAETAVRPPPPPATLAPHTLLPGQTTPQATPTDTATSTPSGSPTVTPTHAPGQVTPRPSASLTPAPAATPVGGTGETSAGGPHPKLFQGVFSVKDVSTDADVLGTNVALATISLLLLVASAELFNKTVEENHDDFKRFFRFIFGPIEIVSTKLHDWAGSGSFAGALGPPLAMLAIGALIYGLAEPGFGVNAKSPVVLVSVLVCLVVLTYFYNGAQILVSNNFGVKTAMALFPVGIAFAIVSVALTRLDDFQPLVIYGFIASTIAVGGAERTRDQDGKVIFYPVLALLGLCLAAWLVLAPARTLANDHSGFLAALPAAVAAGLLVGGLEGMFFQMVPIRYLDGHKVWSWSKPAWVVAAGLTVFAVWEILLNHERSSVSSVQHGAPEVAMIAMAVCFVLSVGLYGFFRVKSGMQSAEAGAEA